MTTLFDHRLNRDASFDSICTTCFKTIASENSESKLLAHEERHTCDLLLLLTRAHLHSRQSVPDQASTRSIK